MEKRISLFIGLLKADMQTALNKSFVLKRVTQELNQIGVLGFNADFIKGSWNGKEEDTLNVSFINTFGIKKTILKSAVSKLKADLEQESILMVEDSPNYWFI